jgi:hypothetical protein
MNSIPQQLPFSNIGEVYPKMELTGGPTLPPTLPHIQASMDESRLENPNAKKTYEVRTERPIAPAGADFEAEDIEPFRYNLVPGKPAADRSLALFDGNRFFPRDSRHPVPARQFEGDRRRHYSARFHEQPPHWRDGPQRAAARSYLGPTPERRWTWQDTQNSMRRYFDRDGFEAETEDEGGAYFEEDEADGGGYEGFGMADLHARNVHGSLNERATSGRCRCGCHGRGFGPLVSRRDGSFWTFMTHVYIGLIVLLCVHLMFHRRV